MVHIARVKVVTPDRPEVIDVLGNRTLVCACAGARSVKLGDRSIGSAHIAVVYVAAFDVTSRNLSKQVDCASRKSRNS